MHLSLSFFLFFLKKKRKKKKEKFACNFLKASMCLPFLVICNMPIILSVGPIECPFFDKILRKRGVVIPLFKVVFKMF